MLVVERVDAFTSLADPHVSYVQRSEFCRRVLFAMTYALKAISVAAMSGTGGGTGDGHQGGHRYDGRKVVRRKWYHWRWLWCEHSHRVFPLEEVSHE